MNRPVSTIPLDDKLVLLPADDAITVVVDRGGNGPLRLAVVERMGCRCDGARCLPASGGTVGRIADGRYVTARPSASARRADILGWADAAATDLAGAKRVRLEGGGEWVPDLFLAKTARMAANNVELCVFVCYI